MLPCLCNKSQRELKYDKNISDTLACISCVTFLFSLHVNITWGSLMKIHAWQHGIHLFI